jgi:hypothetical protein
VVTRHAPAFRPGPQIHRIALDLDGSVDAIVSAALTRAGGLVTAVLADMRASGLVA